MHGRWLTVLFVVAVLHYAEHVAQIFQHNVAGIPMKASLGLMGYVAPMVAESEWLHWLYNASLLLLLVVLLPGMSAGRGRAAWLVTLGIQVWHFSEHTFLTAQHVVGRNWGGADHHVQLAEFFWPAVPRLELHFTYNTLVTVPLLLAIWWHVFVPPRGETLVTPCRCAVQRRLRQAALLRRADAARSAHRA